MRRTAPIITLAPEHVRLIRERARMTRPEFAAYLCVHEETIRRWESPADDVHHGRVPPWAAKILRGIEARLFQGERL